MEVLDLLNKPYKLNGRGPDSYDCWGLVMEVYRRLGITLLDINNVVLSRRDIIRMMQAHEPMTGFQECQGDPKDFDLLYDARKGHVGMIVGNKVLHAADGFGVVYMPLDMFKLTNPYARYYAHRES
jgi:cell wall-associated NlpC family hydrolase